LPFKKDRKYRVLSSMEPKEICQKKIMTNNFQIKPLPAETFAHLFDLGKEQLLKIGAIEMTADKQPGYPCRVSLEDVAPGEQVILLPYQHHNTGSPYQSSGPIFVRKNAVTAKQAVNEIPLMLQHRLLSLRAYDKDGFMQASMVTQGAALKEILQQTFENAQIEYIHIHNAKAGCYNCVAERV
jgi:hypothetical protein